MAAFDAAVLACGIANFNLIRLSSVVPPGSIVEAAPGPAAPSGRWGDRLYLVYARRDCSEPGRAAWAGLGWIQNDETGAGLFVEHDADNEAKVRADISSSLDAMAKSRALSFDPPMVVTGGVSCVDRPVAVVVAAVFGTRGWGPPGPEATYLD